MPRRQRRDVEQQHVLDVALKHARLDRRAHGDDFVRVHAGVRLLAEEFLHDFADARHAGHAADQHDIVDVAGLEAGVGERLLHRLVACGRSGPATSFSRSARVIVSTR